MLKCGWRTKLESNQRDRFHSPPKSSETLSSREKSSPALWTTANVRLGLKSDGSLRDKRQPRRKNGLLRWIGEAQEEMSDASIAQHETMRGLAAR